MKTRTVTEEIDWQLSNLGRIWVAEYLHAGAFDKRLNRELFGTLSAPKPIHTGQWIDLARRIRQSFEERGLPTVVEGLKELDFGVLGDRTHSVSRLSDFLNTFSHGALNATEEENRTHEALLKNTIAKVPGIRDQPILFRAEDGRAIMVADTGQPYPVPASGIAAPPFPQPFIVGREGKTVLHLYPLLHMTSNAQLMPSDIKNRTHPIDLLFERYAIGALVERYQKEKKGYLDFNELVRQRVTHPMPRAVLDEIDAALSGGHILVVFEAHPGCGKASVLTHLLDADVSTRHAAVWLWLVEPDDIGQSGVTFANFLLRKTEGCLGLADESLGLTKAEGWQPAMDKAKQALARAGKRMLVGIEDLHAGCEPVGKESVSVASVYRSLASGPITVVATMHPGRAPERLPFDWRLPADRVPVPDETDISLDRLGVAVRELCPNTHPMRLRVMRELVRRSQPATLFAICDAIETDGGQVFEPEVERALWDLRPLLRVTGTADAKTWSPFTPALSRVRAVGGNQ